MKKMKKAILTLFGATLMVFLILSMAQATCISRISGYVWKDLNCNGCRNNNEPIMIGVTVQLLNADGTILTTTDTNANGAYKFTGLCTGTYTVAVIPSSGYNASPRTVKLTTGSCTIGGINFGLCSKCTGSIGDFVWHDSNRNGIQDTGELGIGGVTVKLKDSTDTIIIATTNTNTSGYYHFTGLCAGDYKVEVMTPSGFYPTTPCSADQTIPNDSNCSPALVKLPMYNSSNQTIDFGFYKPCKLKVDKKCKVELLPTGDFVCSNAKPLDTLAVVWEGDDDPRYNQPIYVKAWNGSVGSGTPKTFGPISIGAEVEFTRSGSFPNDIYWEICTDSDCNNKIGESTFHLSCSDEDMNGPEDCGNPEGDGKGKTGYLNLWKFEGMAGNGLVLDCTPTPVEPEDNCSFVAPVSPGCNALGKPKSLTFRYTGADCLANTNSQASDKWDCIGNPGVDPVSIDIVKDVSKITVDKNSVNTNDLVTVSAIESDMGSEIQLNVGGQFLKIHTSCSQPLAAGDVFGSLELVKFNDQGAGAEVTYSYEIVNIGATDAKVISVVDSELGNLLDNPLILSPGPGNSYTIEKTVMISETTTNTVKVTGEPGGCIATDSVIVTVPLCTVTQTFYTVEDDKYNVKLTNTGNKVATLDTLILSWPDEAAYKSIKEVKLDGSIYRKDMSNLVVGSGVPIGPLDWTNPDVTKRQLDPGETRTLEIVFSAKWPKANCPSGECFSGTASFNEEGCEVDLSQQ
jgi:serine-aspartate repeat-containing protein C/D/E